MEFSGKNLRTLLLSLSVCVCEFHKNKCSESHNLLKDANLNVSLFSTFFRTSWTVLKRIPENLGAP